MTKKQIACLPVTGDQNPYQNLMMEGLNSHEGLHAFHGIEHKFLGIFITLIKFRPDYLHFDWIGRYYFRRWKWLTLLSIPLFCLQILLAKRLGIRLVWTLHNILPHDSAQVGLHRFCQRFFAKHCDWIRVFAEETVTRAAAELQVPIERFRVVAEGDYTSMYLNTVSRDEARAVLGLPDSAKVLLYVGVIRPYKGVQELVALFKRLAPPDTQLILAGKVLYPDYGDTLRASLTPAIRLYDGFVDKDHLQYYFNAADMVVLPFRNIENSGSVIMAMGFKKLIIAPRTGVLKTRLAQQAEWLYEGDEELGALMLKAVSLDPKECTALGEQNYVQLNTSRWTDFARCFEPTQIPSSTKHRV